MTIRLIAQAIVFLLQNVKWDGRGPSLSEINAHISSMARIARSN